MLGLRPKHAHFIYGGIQSALTCAVSAAVASFPFVTEGSFLRHWVGAWGLSWAIMLPVVLLIAPVIRSATEALTRRGSDPARSDESS